MGEWKLVFLEYAFNSPRAEIGPVGIEGEERIFLKYNDGVPYKIKYKRNGDTIEVRAFADPFLISRPWFDAEYHSEGHTQYEIEIPRFFDPEELEMWLQEKGIRNHPNFKDMYKKTQAFYDEIKRLDELRKDNKLTPEEIRFKCC